jgi:hypothetical protein
MVSVIDEFLGFLPREDAEILRGIFSAVTTQRREGTKARRFLRWDFFGVYRAKALRHRDAKIFKVFSFFPLLLPLSSLCAFASSRLCVSLFANKFLFSSFFPLRSFAPSRLCESLFGDKFFFSSLARVSSRIKSVFPGENKIP